MLIIKHFFIQNTIQILLIQNKLIYTGEGMDEM